MLLHHEGFMIIYTAKYKLPGQWFWRKVKNVYADEVENWTRVLVLVGEKQIHLPTTAAVIWSKERFASRKKKFEATAGQPIATNDTYGQ